MTQAVPSFERRPGPAAGPSTLVCKNPATGEIFGEVPVMGPAEVG